MSFNIKSQRITYIQKGRKSIKKIVNAKHNLLDENHFSTCSNRNIDFDPKSKPKLDLHIILLYINIDNIILFVT